MKEETKKTTINLPNSIYETIKKEADKLGINFNAMIIIKLNKIIEQEQQIIMLKDTVNLLQNQESK